MTFTEKRIKTFKRSFCDKKQLFKCVSQKILEEKKEKEDNRRNVGKSNHAVQTYEQFFYFIHLMKKKFIYFC